MGFLSFSGRMLFSAIFVFGAWRNFNEFRHGEGGALDLSKTKYGYIFKHAENIVGFNIPTVQLSHLAATLALVEGLGATLFTCGSTWGAYILLSFLAVVNPITQDFYILEVFSSDFTPHFIETLKKSPSDRGSIVQLYTNLALIGALLFFLGTKRSYAKRRQRKAKAH